MLGIIDAFAPHCNFMNCPILLVLNKAIEKPIVKDGKVAIA
jgi:pyruvate/2-oxoglutarate dehydrogenase complex dihydrolipoamide acyltransferase (E2) component